MTRLARTAVLVMLLPSGFGCGQAALVTDSGSVLVEAGDGLEEPSGNLTEAGLDLRSGAQCMDAIPSEAAGSFVPMGPPTCGGEVSVGGPSPYGFFVAENVWTVLEDGD